MIQKPKGTQDIYGKKAKTIKYLEKLIESVAEKYNFSYSRTPVFERSEVFHRGVGDTTDIVTKETYDFIDRGNRQMTLRPEGTAALVRCFLENKLYSENINKFWYFEPMFRYERPQSGRFREHYQFGFEAFGSNDPMLDAEIISIPVTIYKLLGLKGIKVNVNTLGDAESRKNYRIALINYFKPYINDLCDDCKQRLEKNPLRILDCKVDCEKEIMKNIPKMSDYLNDESKVFFESVKKYLDAYEINYEVKDTLVRGLDYYTHTVFEVEADIKGFGAQNVLCGGGRYNSLIKTLDGPDTPALGFGMGVERLMNALEAEEIVVGDKKTLDCFIITISDNEKTYAAKLLYDLRINGFSVDADYLSKNLKGQFKEADKYNSKFIIILGEEEVKTGMLTVKDMILKEENKIYKEEIIDFLDMNVG
ncbi:MAG: histidine--tRNA ligase, partial [Bacilli bacterium]